MSIYLTSTLETYHVDTEHEVDSLVNEAKSDTRYSLAKYTSELKNIKEKGEIIDEYYKVTLNKVFTELKEPDREVSVNYTVDIPTLAELPIGLEYESEGNDED